MCGRYTLTSPEDVAARFGLDLDLGVGRDPVPEIEPRFNIAPSQEALIVTGADRSKTEARLAVWGFSLPSRGAGRPGRRVINARSEEVGNRPLFRESLDRRRCLVPSDGFYEWTKIGRIKQPYYFSLPDGSVFGFAGLWNPGPGERRSYVILTTAANDVVAPIHDRMPVIVRPEDYSSWLAGGRLPDGSARKILGPWPSESLTAQAVGLRVNDPSADDRSCVRPLQGPVDLFTY